MTEKSVRKVTYFYNHTMLYLNITSKSKVFLIIDWFYLKHSEFCVLTNSPSNPPPTHTHTHTHRTIQFFVENQIQCNLPLSKSEETAVANDSGVCMVQKHLHFNYVRVCVRS